MPILVGIAFIFLAVKLFKLATKMGRDYEFWFCNLIKVLGIMAGFMALWVVYSSFHQAKPAGAAVVSTASLRN